MKTIKNNVSTFFLFSILSLWIVAFAACDSDSDADTTRPAILLIAPTEGAELLIGDKNGVLFEAEFSDDTMLASYNVNIHKDDGSHTHTRSTEDNSFSFVRSWKLSGTSAKISHRDIIIPEGVDAGRYHLVVSCADASGNEIHVAHNIILTDH